jgi:uncharacterized membrane protein YtjA (UPF0391 family)
MLGSVLASSVNAAFEETPFARTETFESHTGIGASPARSALVSFLVMIILFTIILFVGKYLWNSVLAELIPAIKPAKSVFQILGLSILIALLFPGSCQC